MADVVSNALIESFLDVPRVISDGTASISTQINIDLLIQI